MKDAVIVGSGLAGLSAAHYLQQGGWRVKVLESADRIAGRVSTTPRQGYVVDDGPTAVSTSYTRYMALVNELGLSDQVVESSNIMGFVRNDVIHAIDGRHPLRGFIATKLMSWSEKLQLVRGMISLVKDMRGIKLSDASGYEQYDVESMCGYLQRHFSGELIEGLFDPLAHCVTYGNKHEASCVELFCGLNSASGKLINILGGLDALPRAIARNVEVKLEAPVSKVEKIKDKVMVHYTDHAAGGEPSVEHADACVITLTFQQAGELYPPVKDEGPALYAQDRIAPSYAVYLGYRTRTRSSLAAIALPEREYPLIPAIFLDHNKAPDRAPAGHSLLTVYYSSAAVPKLKEWSETQMMDDAQRVAEHFFPELAGSIDFRWVRFFERASHLAPAGHFKAVREFLDNHRADDPVQLAGDYFSIPSQETAVYWGHRAASNLLAAHGR